MCNKLSAGERDAGRKIFSEALKSFAEIIKNILFVLKFTYIIDCWMSNPAVPTRQNAQQLCLPACVSIYR